MHVSELIVEVASNPLYVLYYLRNLSLYGFRVLRAATFHSSAIHLQFTLQLYTFSEPLVNLHHHTSEISITSFKVLKTLKTIKF